MDNKGIFTKILAVAGIILVWFPILFPLVISAVKLIQSQRFLFDYLMPAEFFPVSLAGALLLLWAAFRVHAFRKLIVWGTGAAVFFFIAFQLVAVFTGLASGETEPAGMTIILVNTGLVLFIAAVLELCVVSILLLIKVFSDHSASQPS
ncbi:MAG: hypothetical protein VB070_13225 [Clostridiaceae bacterium]|nr:hypothetical protein [Clostridiaceae bacterium]